MEYPGKAVSHGLEFGFGVEAVDKASPLTGALGSGRRKEGRPARFELSFPDSTTPRPDCAGASSLGADFAPNNAGRQPLHLPLNMSRELLGKLLDSN